MNMPIKWVIAILAGCMPAMVFAQGFNGMYTQQVPALDEFGLVGLIVALGVVAGWIIRRRGK